MKVGDLVLFRSDTVPGVIVSERCNDLSPKNPRIGVLWMDSINEVCWEPVDLSRVISETEKEKRRT